MDKEIGKYGIISVIIVVATIFIILTLPPFGLFYPAHGDSEKYHVAIIYIAPSMENCDYLMISDYGMSEIVFKYFYAEGYRNLRVSMECYPSIHPHGYGFFTLIRFIEYGDITILFDYGTNRYQPSVSFGHAGVVSGQDMSYNGQGEFFSGVIYVNSSSDFNSRVDIGIHELAHAVLYLKGLSSSIYIGWVHDHQMEYMKPILYKDFDGTRKKVYVLGHYEKWQLEREGNE